MPELPEVETVVRDLRRLVDAQTPIRRANAYWPPMIRPLAPGAFAAALRGRRILRIERRAKYIVLTLSGGRFLLVHLRMTGQFRMAQARAPRDPHEHVILEFGRSRSLRYHDTRKFGRWHLTDRPGQWLDRLGPEPLGPDFTPAWFDTALRRKNRQLKPLLLDQSFLAGLGNIYVDEALWEAQVHPRRASGSLAPAEVRRLHHAIRSVLRRAIRNRGTSLGVGQDNFSAADGRRGGHQRLLRVFQRTGQACPRCGAPIQRLTVAQRGTHLCPRCQPEKSRKSTGN